MKSINIQAHRGPNIWSIQHPKLIQLRLEIELDNESVFERMYNDLNQIFPSPISEKPKGLADFVGALALRLQQECGHAVGFYLTKTTIETEVTNVVFEYLDEDTGKESAKLAVYILESTLKNEAIDLNFLIKELRSTAARNKLDEFTEFLIKGAKSLDIPYLLQEKERLIQLGYGIHAKKLSFAASATYPPKDISAIEFLKSFFPEPTKARIPIIAVTGTNGKTTTTRLIAHVLKESGIVAGFTTSDGIYVGDEMVDKGDTTGPMSAQIALGDPRIEAAILECARGGIVRAGLGFDQCDIAVITNIQEDHLGLSDIHTLAELASAKGIIIDVLKEGGYAVCNAENEYALLLGMKSKFNKAFFAMDESNTSIQNHISKGGLACVSDNGIITILKGDSRIPVADVENIPITFGGRVSFMVQNALAATLACSIYGLNADQIGRGMASFFPSAEQTPGRLNVFDYGDGHIMIDFAHNPDGFRGIRDFVYTLSSPFKIGIITGTGDRRDSDLLELGSLSAQMFDHIIISQRKFLRGRTDDEIVGFLVEGIKSHNPNASYEYISDDVEPMAYALSIRKPDSFICALSDVLDKPLEIIPNYIRLIKEGKM